MQSCAFTATEYFSEYICIQVTGTDFSVLSFKPTSVQTAQKLLLASHLFMVIFQLLFLWLGFVCLVFLLLLLLLICICKVSLHCSVTHIYFCMHSQTCLHAHTLFCTQINPIRPRCFLTCRESSRDPRAGRLLCPQCAESPCDWLASILAILEQRGPSITCSLR